MASRRIVRGFTLIELVVTMAIVGILAALAIPQYSEYVSRSRRTEARGQLLLAAQWMERFRAENGGVYTNAALPAALSRSPASGTALYDIAIGAVTAVTWTLNATPRSDGPHRDDACGALTLASDGQRTAATATSGTLFDRCWGR